jgi:hypothetical protein
MTDLPFINIKHFTLAQLINRMSWPNSILMVDTQQHCYRRKPDGKTRDHGSMQTKKRRAR